MAQGGPATPAGLALVVRQGMTTWMSSWRGPATNSGVAARTRLGPQVACRDSEPWRAEMVRVLAELILNNVSGEGV